MKKDNLKKEAEEKTNLIVEGIRLLDRELNLTIEKSIKKLLDITSEQIEQYKNNGDYPLTVSILL